MLTVVRSGTFDQWITGLRDRQGVQRINARIERIAATGNVGDTRAVGDGVSELRFDFGPGYRVYFIREAARVIVLLGGGDKDSQQRDISRAKQLAEERRN